MTPGNRWLLAGALAAGIAAAPAVNAAQKHKIFLSMSYIGNDWQAEAANMVKAMAAHKSLADKVSLEVQVAGPNAQRQIQQINAMVQAGAEAIVIFPISPTALNQVVKSAEGLVDRRRGVIAVQLVQVDVVGLQAPQGGLDRGEDVLAGVAGVEGRGPGRGEALGGDDEPVAPAVQPAPEDLLGDSPGGQVPAQGIGFG